MREPRTDRFARSLGVALIVVLVIVSTAACGKTDGTDALVLDSTTPTLDLPTATPTQYVPLDPTSTSVPVMPTANAPEASAEPDGGDEPVAQDAPIEQATNALFDDGDIEHIDASQLHAVLETLLDGLDGDIEVVVALPDGTVLFEHNSAVVMEAASLYKLAIMVEIFRLRETGELTFEDTILLLPDYFLEEDGVFGEGDVGSVLDIRSLLVYMIDYSSNIAAAALLARAGNESINATMQDVGLTSTEIRWTPGIWVPIDSYAPPVPTPEDPEDPEDSEGIDVPDDIDPFGPADQSDPFENEILPPGRSSTHRTLLSVHLERTSERSELALNVTTAADIAMLYMMLLRGELVSPAASDEMLELLKGQYVTDRIPRYLPEGTVTAHKTGNWDGLVHDAGIIWAPLGPIIVSVMSDIGDEWRAVEIISSIALAAYAFNSE